MSSNVLIDHVLGAIHPSVGDSWRLRKGSRIIVIDEVYDRYVLVHEKFKGRRSTISTEVLVGKYILESNA